MQTTNEREREIERWRKRRENDTRITKAIYHCSSSKWQYAAWFFFLPLPFLSEERNHFYFGCVHEARTVPYSILNVATCFRYTKNNQGKEQKKTGEIESLTEIIICALSTASEMFFLYLERDACTLCVSHTRRMCCE